MDSAAQSNIPSAIGGFRTAERIQGPIRHSVLRAFGYSELNSRSNAGQNDQRILTSEKTTPGASSGVVAKTGFPILEDEHSENEERWVTLGLAEDNTLLVVVHTLERTRRESGLGAHHLGTRRDRT